VGVAAFHLLEQLPVDVPLKWKNHLHDRHLRLGHQSADDRLVGGERLGAATKLVADHITTAQQIAARG